MMNQNIEIINEMANLHRAKTMNYIAQEKKEEKFRKCQREVIAYITRQISRRLLPVDFKAIIRRQRYYVKHVCLVDG